MEVEKAAFLVHQETEILAFRKLGHLAKELVLGVAAAIPVWPIALILPIKKPLLRHPEGVIDRVTEIGGLKFPLEPVRLGSNHDILRARHGKLDVNDRWDCSVCVVGSLFDPHPACYQPVEDALKVGDVIADLSFRPILFINVMEGDLGRDLHAYIPRPPAACLSVPYSVSPPGSSSGHIARTSLGSESRILRTCPAGT